MQIILSFGATEAKPPEDADAIIDNTSTGETLRKNNLVELDTVLEKSTAWLIANPDALRDKDKRSQILKIATALHGAIVAKKALHLFATVPEQLQDQIGLSPLSEIARGRLTIIRAHGGLRLDLLIERRDYHKREIAIRLS